MCNYKFNLSWLLLLPSLLSFLASLGFVGLWPSIHCRVTHLVESVRPNGEVWSRGLWGCRSRGPKPAYSSVSSVLPNGVGGPRFRRWSDTDLGLPVMAGFVHDGPASCGFSGDDGFIGFPASFGFLTMKLCFGSGGVGSVLVRCAGIGGWRQWEVVAGVGSVLIFFFCRFLILFSKSIGEDGDADRCWFQSGVGEVDAALMTGISCRL
ncbi:hypothetical protein RHGRI_036499 [Rhododendron griersonianum]|uniref:Transmembrane protein n=1 Tax=Rhododendron griersonianum TaxID=479676 RepID=A0AAV6HTU5_9ERIC|nr:hypothetical protein RHGRI_036499 [Rhododendron griersonianum]